MLEVFADESGDLGFTTKATRYFVVAFVITESSHELRTRITRLLKRLHARRKYALPEFKFSRTNEAMRLVILQQMMRGQFDVGLCVVDKARIRTNLRSLQNILYNYVLGGNVVHQLLSYYEKDRRMTIVLDKSLSARQRQAFEEYVRDKASYLWRNELKKPGDIAPNSIDVRHEPSDKEGCLQIADFLAGSAFSRYEHNDNRFYDVIKGRIVFEKSPWQK
jgi:hypothetical protein